MTKLVPMFISLLIWFVLWFYIIRLDRKLKDIEKNA